MRRTEQIGSTSPPDLDGGVLDPYEGRDLDDGFVVADAMVPGYLDLAEVEAEYGLFERVRFDHTPFSSAKLRGVRMVDAELDRCDTSNADFAGSRLNRVVFSNCRMTGVTLAGASLRRHCDFSGARMRAVDLRGSEIALSGRASDLAGAIVSPMQLGELAGSLAEGAGIRVE